MTKLEEQLRLAKEGGFKEIVIPVQEAEKALELMKKEQKAISVPPK